MQMMDEEYKRRNMNPDESIEYMKQNVVKGQAGCSDDNDERCPSWAGTKYCTVNGYRFNGTPIKDLCKKSCGTCICLLYTSPSPRD